MRQSISGTSPRRLRRAIAFALATISLVSAAHAADGVPVPLPQPQDLSKKPKKTSVVPSQSQIDINRASREQLKTLPGIGDAEAKKIIAGRPYVSKADLVTKKVLPEGLYISIRYRIIAIPADQPKQ
jgi:DNA uptake protein ComE-like DNA-binding protein